MDEERIRGDVVDFGEDEEKEEKEYMRSGDDIE